MAMAYSQQYPWNLYLINNEEDKVIFLDLKVFNFDNSVCFPGMEMCFWRETSIENNQFPWL